MEIVVKRIAKKKTYTIGHLYILSDKDVKRTWRSGVKIGDKRIFEHSFDMTKLDKEHYFCDTLEPTWRNLLGVELKPEDVVGIDGRQLAHHRYVMWLLRATRQQQAAHQQIIYLFHRYKDTSFP